MAALLLTPSDGDDDFEAALLLEGVGQQAVEVVALAKHPSVVRQTEVFGHPQQESTQNRILQTGGAKRKGEFVIRFISTSVFRSYFRQHVTFPARVGDDGHGLERDHDEAVQEQGQEEVLVDGDARHAKYSARKEAVVKFRQKKEAAFHKYLTKFLPSAFSGMESPLTRL